MTGDLQFLAEPLVLGGLGMSPPSSLDAVHTRHRLKPVVVRPDGFLYATHGIQPWRSGEARGWVWNPLVRGADVDSMRDAQVHAMASGIAFDRSGAILHNDLLGIQQLFWTRVESGILFSNRMRVLADLAPHLTEDEEAWASTLLLGFAAPGATVFKEIRSLPANGVLRVIDGKAVVSGETLDIPRTSGSGLLSAIRGGLPPSRQPASYTLSGGWDSRFLAAIASKRLFSRTLEAWTTGKDDGEALDAPLARPVAHVLKAKYNEVLPAPDFWPRSVDEALTRFDHATWDHVWLEPLAAAVRSQRQPVVDGLAGDVLFKGLFQDPQEDENGASRDVRFELWLKLGGRFIQDADAWGPRASRMFESAFESFDQSIQDLWERPDWQTLAVLTTRTARAIALSPLRLFGPEIPVYLPFISLPVLGAALGPDVHPHRGSDFYRSLIRSVSPRIASLPSTNDEGAGREADRPRGHRQPEALTSMMNAIRDEEPALELLAPSMRTAVIAGDVDALDQSLGRWRARALWGVYAYASWRQIYRID